MVKKLFTIIVLLSCCMSAAFGQRFLKKGLSAIDEQSARAQLEFLASDAMQGRLKGTPFATISAEYIASELKRLGYEVCEDNFEAKGCTMRNVRAIYRGHDTTRRYVIGAHFDHLGVRGEDIYNGADDNASGVVAVLQIASALKAANVKPKVDIELAFWDGEENGLNGSKHYVANVSDISSIIGYMNFDLIGRNTDEQNPGLFRYFYSAKRPDYVEFMNEAVRKWDLDILVPDYRGAGDDMGGSDNASFNRNGVPIIWYHTDGHADFHKPSDTADKINWPKMMQIICSAYIVSWQAANQM